MQQHGRFTVPILMRAFSSWKFSSQKRSKGYAFYPQIPLPKQKNVAMSFWDLVLESESILNTSRGRQHVVLSEIVRLGASSVQSFHAEDARRIRTDVDRGARGVGKKDR